MTFPKVPREVWEALEWQVNSTPLECADNFRAYRERDGLYKKQFVEAEEKGCCGNYESWTIYSGDKWIIGCNYGH